MTAGWRRAGWEAAAVGRSVRNALRESGPERDTMVQALKAAAAAILAWAIVGVWIKGAMALLAPWTALAMVDVTVYRTLRTGLQQSAIIVVGALWASVAMYVTGGSTLVAMAIALPLLMLAGTYRRLGAYGIYGATTALFVITYGSYKVPQIGDRLLETAVGAAIGIAVNVLVLPPLHLSDVRDNLRVLARESADLLGAIADGLPEEWDAATAEGWQDRARRLGGTVRAVDEARRWSAESRRFNPGRRWRHRRLTPPPGVETDRHWEAVVDHLGSLTRTLAGIASRSPALTSPVHGFLVQYASLAGAMGRLCGHQGDLLVPRRGEDHEADDAAAADASAAWAAYEDLMRTFRDQRDPAAIVSGGVLVETRQLLVTLAPERRGDGM
ncbi:FUSC family protein [Streptomyces bomunensis]|uniref:FUSC family protein n=1 Tax=Streptomyces montanisoli TaxID=2798581 RepID=A0A940MF10_9ACTN|nr:FUSC family protein [Streptomyces montanisoli]